MAYFPESIMPARIKNESADVDGNQYIISAADHNRHDSEIRAIEKVIGVPTLPVSGFSGPANPCSMVNVLLQILAQLQVLRDDFIIQTSGVVAVKDITVLTADGIIPFPSTWDNTVLVDAIPDASVTDEEALDPIDSVELADIDGLPEEGYISIINDESTTRTYVSHSLTLQVTSPTRANAKVGKSFLYEIQTNRDAVFSATNLPPGLTLSGAQITGTPTTTGTTVASITATATATSTSTAGAQVNFNLSITVVAAATPAITSVLIATGATGTLFTYTITFTGVPNEVVVTGLPDGVTYFGQNIAGTPRLVGVSNIQMTISDEFGDSDTKTLVLTVS